MRIIGWIRKDDVATCGGVVAEGFDFMKSMGGCISFQGARMACTKGCVIAEGEPRSTVNGVHKVIHGMKTSCGCPLLSTLNDIDGVCNQTGQVVPTEFFLNADNEWVGVAPVTDKLPYDERTKLQTPHAEGTHYFVQTNDGRTFSGRVGRDGLLPRIETFGSDEYTVLWGDEALDKIIERAGT